MQKLQVTLVDEARHECSLVPVLQLTTNMDVLCLETWKQVQSCVGVGEIISSHSRHSCSSFPYTCDDNIEQLSVKLKALALCSCKINSSK